MMQDPNNKFIYIKQLLAETPAHGFNELIEYCRETENSELKINAILLAGKYKLADSAEQFTLRNEGLQGLQAVEEKKSILKEAEALLKKAGDVVNNNHFTRVSSPAFPQRIESVSPAIISINNYSKRHIFKCRNIRKSFSKTDFVLKDVSLELEEGQITGVVGMNGYGKSTLLKIIAGELMPDTGEVSYDTLDDGKASINWPLIKSQVAFLQQDIPVLKGNIKKRLRLSASLNGFNGYKNEDEVNYIISRLGLTGYEDTLWKDLSGGYRLRCALAKVLVGKPRLLVLDEPLANLDINTQLLVLNDLRKMTDIPGNRMSVVISSQNLEEVEAVADRMIVLNKGQIIHNGPSGLIGISSKENVFEIKTPLEQPVLMERLSRLKYLRLSHNAFYFIITVPLTTGKLDFIKYCAEEEIVLDYFNDITSSVKKLILQH